MFCKKCGKQIDENSKFCIHCGTIQNVQSSFDQSEGLKNQKSYIEERSNNQRPIKIEHSKIPINNTNREIKWHEKPISKIIIPVVLVFIFLILIKVFIPNRKENSSNVISKDNLTINIKRLNEQKIGDDGLEYNTWVIEINENKKVVNEIFVGESIH